MFWKLENFCIIKSPGVIPDYSGLAAISLSFVNTATKAKTPYFFKGPGDPFLLY